MPVTPRNPLAPKIDHKLDMSRNIEICHIDIVLKIYGSYLKNHSTDVLHVCAQFNAFPC